MDTSYWNKATLYCYVNNLRQQLLPCSSAYPIDSKALAKRWIKNLFLEELSFPSNKICGILYKGERSTSIALNATRSPEMQNFDCMHELVHYYLHDIKRCQCICADNAGKTGVSQDKILEWQANEGAAQFLIPYHDFIPKLSHLIDFPPHLDFWYSGYLAEYYNVSIPVIECRIDNLSYEIDQYRSGVSIDKIRVLSKTQQARQGIKATCYNAVCAFAATSYVSELNITRSQNPLDIAFFKTYSAENPEVNLAFF